MWAPRLVSKMGSMMDLELDVAMGPFTKRNISNRNNLVKIQQINEFLYSNLPSTDILEISLTDVGEIEGKGVGVSDGNSEGSCSKKKRVSDVSEIAVWLNL